MSDFGRWWDEKDGRETPESRLALLRDPSTWPLFYHTATNMQLRQLGGVLERHLRHAVVPRLPLDFDERYDQRVPLNLDPKPEAIRSNTDHLRGCLPGAKRQVYQQHVSEAVDGEVTFLNATLPVAESGDLAWFHHALEDVPALWALKLHGFEFLNWAFLGHETPTACPDGHATFQEWIRSWVHSDDTDIGTEQYLRSAWTPHSVSLRVLNLSRYYCWCAEEPVDAAFLRLLRRLIFKNALFLENHVEYDIGGNHLIENAVALVIAGVLFDDADQKWLDTGVSVLEDTSTQFLDDGGHFERTPMYHILTLTRYLTVVDLLRASGRNVPPEIGNAAQRAAEFLYSIRPPDGRIPLLNDSVFGQALALDTCLAYARAVGIEPGESPPRIAMPSSGYYWLGEGDDRLLVDGGVFGPPHLPAHSHNDLFAIMLWVDGFRLLTDTGTYEYAPTARRQYSRSVRGHNTVQVGSMEPIPIGGQYLAGRRLQPSVRYLKRGDITLFDGSYGRRRRVGTSYSHRRRIFAGPDWWLVEDRVTGETSQRQRVRSRLHLHPSVVPDSREDGESRQSGGELTELEFSVGGEPKAYIVPLGTQRVTETTRPYFPEFGVERPRSSLLLEGVPSSATTGFLLSKTPHTVHEYRQLTDTIENWVRNVPDDVEPPGLSLPKGGSPSITIRS